MHMSDDAARAISMIKDLSDKTQLLSNTVSSFQIDDPCLSG